ncbi:MAG: FAD-binding oxidoreductase [Alphaproteobacteria bacterium]|nr:FAD-binding oxidoreductase [Alphaproteobacteria bacterium]
MSEDADFIVLGGGLVGSAIGYGLLRRGKRVVVLDEGDVALRASRGNFGLVWVQGKGLGMPAYADWARLSADVWPEFYDELRQRTGIDCNYRKPGGFQLCMGEKDQAERVASIDALRAQQGAKGYDCELVERRRLDNVVPGLGPDVVAGLYCPHDGHVSPLQLLKSLHKALGDAYRPYGAVTAIRGAGGGYAVEAGGRTYAAPKIVLAAGLGNLPLCAMLGFKLPVRPQRGQILVTERLPAFLDYPLSGVRQTEEGSVMLGNSREEVGYDNGTTPEAMRSIAANGIRVFPRLQHARIVRAWGALRILAPDEFPIYQTVPGHDGAMVATCHSGVSLAGAHALRFAGYLADWRLPPHFDAFHSRRFDVPKTA